MDEAATTWALVVGIDEYDRADIPRLAGAGADAVAAVGWLRRLGVPPAQILLHLAPSAATKPAADALGVPFRDARKPAIVGSINGLRRIRGGTRLFVFLSGHGIYEPVGKRLFLPQDAGVDDIWVNLALDRYCDLLRSMAFRRQFLVMDGCLNYPQDPGRRPTIEAEGFPGPADLLPDPNVGLTACYSASQAQRAVELAGRGVFLRRLLEALDLDRPRPDAVHLDLRTGARAIDLRKLVQELLVPEVGQEVFAATRLVQTPRLEALGSARSVGRVTVCRLPDQPTVEVRLTVKPPVAAGDVTEVRVALRDEPYSDCTIRVPPAASIDVPVTVHLPVGADAWARCQLPATAPWDVVRRDVDLHRITKPRTYAFQLSARPTPQAQAPAEEVFSVRQVGPAGIPVPSVDYGAAATRMGLDRPPAEGAEVAAGVTIEHHEVGPDFRVRAGAHAAAAEHAARWARAVTEAAPPDTAIELAVRGSVAPEDPPNLRILGPDGGREALAGALAGHRVLWVGPPDAPDRGQLLRLPTDPAGTVVRIPAGPFQLRLDLPWGSWAHAGFVPTSGEAVVELPAGVGATPLRVTLHAVLGPNLVAGGRIVGVTGDRPTGRVLAGLTGDPSGRGVDLAGREGARGTAWELAPARPLPDAGIAVLDGTPQVRFPLLPDRSVAVERLPAATRVEPLSDVDAPEWDLLVTVGGLGALTAAQAAGLTTENWFDPLLGLAGAYAVWANGHWDYLRIVLDNLHRLPTAGPDVDLLAAARERAERGRLSAATVDRLAEHAAAGAVPLFRWGVPLALDLAGAVRAAGDGGRDGRLAAWRAALAGVSASLAATSVWTAWTV